MKRVLFSASIDIHILSFHIHYLKWFKERGFEVHVASNGNSDIPYTDVKHNVAFERSPFKISNLKAYRQLKKIIKHNKYDIIHCHTPMAGVLTRLAAINARDNGTKVLYTVHGFHFFNGAPRINWRVYYPVEKILSKYTDCLLTMNREDYQNAMKFNFKAKSIKLVNGVGIDLNKFAPQTEEVKKELRKKYGYAEDDFILLYTAELNNNKNQKFLIKVIDKLKNQIPNIKLLLAGTGKLEVYYKRLVKELNLDGYIVFLGYRKDISNLLKMSDIAVSSSRREGLPVNVMEAMATGLPAVVTNCRGNRDLISHEENGYVVDIDDIESFAQGIYRLYKSPQLRSRFGIKNLRMIRNYSCETTCKSMEDIYLEYLED